MLSLKRVAQLKDSSTWHLSSGPSHQFPVNNINQTRRVDVYWFCIHMMNYMFRDGVYTTYQTVINWFLYTNILSSPESRIFNYRCFWLYRMVLPGCYRVKILFPHIFHYFNKKYSRTRALDQLKVFKRFTTKSMHVLH